MANHTGTDQGVPDNPVNDGDLQAGVQIVGDDAASANAPEEVTSASVSAQLRLLPIFPILLGVSICALNIFAAARIWRTVYNSNSTWFSRLNLPTNTFLVLISTSFFIGLFLIIYTLILRHFERNLNKGAIPDTAGQNPLYVKWLIVPLFIALLAPTLTVWATQMVEPIEPKPCIELYQEAQNIKNDNPNFKMVWTDRDERRCAINQAVLTK